MTRRVRPFRILAMLTLPFLSQLISATPANAQLGETPTVVNTCTAPGHSYVLDPAASRTSIRANTEAKECRSREKNYQLPA
jgi:hypothetical protein